MILLVNALMEFQKDNAMCKLCISGMDEVYHMIEDGIIKDGIMAALDLICKQLPEPVQVKQCETFIVTEYDKLVAWLEADYSSEILCTLMGACDYPHPPINSACDACMVGFTLLTDIWSYGPTVELMEWILDQICTLFPEGKWRTECETFINKEFDQLIEWIDGSFPPKYICTVLEACDFPVDPVDDGLCIFCEGAFQFLYDIFDFDTNSMQLIEQVLDYICWVFPENSDSRKQCQTFIDQEYDWLVKYLIGEFPPETVCTLAQACDSPVIPDYSTECEFCMIFYQFALDLLDFDANVDAVITVLQNICRVFQNKLTEKTCDAFVDKYYQKLIDDLTKKYPANVACPAMGACVE